METSASLKIKSARELLEAYELLRQQEGKFRAKGDRHKERILRLLSSIPSNEAKLHKEKIDAIIVKL